MAPSQPGSRKPKMSKMYDGRNVATRPIPILHDSSEDRAIGAAAADSKPLGEIVNFPTTKHVNVKGVLGTKVAGSAKVRGGNYNPIGVEDNR
jgi:hypothetical protein